jgi:flavin-dependent dehydrogenase
MVCDVAVVGAGPAGLATAICCAEAGLQVCVLERATFPRDCVGESVHPGAEVLFQRLGIAKEVAKARFLRYAGISVEHAGGQEFVAFGGTSEQPWKGFHIWRPLFDQILSNRARQAGAHIVERCVPSDAEHTNHGVRISSNAGAVECEIVVDGSGRHRWLARQWSLKAETCSPPLIAQYGYRQGECRSRRDNPLFVARCDGWDWTARVRSNLYQWISLRFGRNSQALAVVPSEIRKLREAGALRGADVTWRLVARSASHRHFLVGDAAAVLDPSSSHGVIRALASGILAASCIEKMLGERRGNKDEIVEGFRAWQRKWFEREARSLRSLNRWGGNVAEFLRITGTEEFGIHGSRD